MFGEGSRWKWTHKLDCNLTLSSRVLPQLGLVYKTDYRRLKE